MENHETLIDFVEKQMTLYNIEKNEINRKKIYKKCQRELEKLEFWQNAPTIIVGRNKTKTFNLGQINILKYKTENYFLKLSPFDKKEIEEIIKQNIEDFENEIKLLSQEENEKTEEEIEEFANAAGFKNCRFYSDFAETPFTEESPELICKIS